MKHYIYILTNKHNKVLYIGETENIKRRISQHRRKSYPNSFSARYNLDKLVYFEEFENSTLAKKRERQMKKWNRDWKIKLIEEINPDWIDLYHNIEV